jgi:hypothetical protein
LGPQCDASMRMNACHFVYATVFVRLLPWAVGCAGDQGAPTPLKDAAVSRDTTACTPSGFQCSTTAECCSLLCYSGRCADPHPPFRQACVLVDDDGSSSMSGRRASMDQSVDCSCPSSQPADGDHCMRPALVCEYGSSNVLSCDALATCMATIPPVDGAVGTWWVLAPDGGPPCAPAPASECPVSGQAIQGMPCNSPSLDCDYADMRCECARDPAALSESTWRCTDPRLAGPGCGVRPRLGTPCSQDGILCNYGACDIAGGNLESCISGMWQILDPLCQTPPCPASPPDAGSMCGAPNVCEYGTSNIVDCDLIAACQQSVWLVSKPHAGSASCQTPSQSACPAAFEAVVRGGGCDGGATFCDYPQGRCRCVGTLGSSNLVWSCQDPPAPCPRPRPRLGSACPQEGLVCVYDPCGLSGGGAQLCRTAVWVPLSSYCDSDASAAAPAGDAGSE